MNRILFLIGLFFMSIQIALSDSVDSLKWIKMPVKTYPDYPVQIQGLGYHEIEELILDLFY